MQKTLYKLDTKGKERFIELTAKDNLLIQRSGVVGSKKSVTNERVCKPKNVGRANATTAEEQAISELESKIKSKLDEGYFLTIQEAKSSEVILPMLAKDYKKESHKIDWDTAYVQPKLDGMRATCNMNEGFISRKGKAVTTMSHILSEILDQPVMDTFDGELYAHGKTFQENMKLIKKYREDETEDVKYHVYDMVYPNHPFWHRYAVLKGIIEATNPQNIELVPTFKVESEEEVKKLHAQFLSEGYEGTIVRWGDDGYKVNGRSSNLLKYKDFIDEAYEIIDVLEGDADPTQGFFRCQLNEKFYYNIDGSGTVTNMSKTKFDGAIYGYPPFTCGMKYSHKERQEFLTNKNDYIGKKSETRFFELTDQGLPRFPQSVGIRLDK